MTVVAVELPAPTGSVQHLLITALPSKHLWCSVSEGPEEARHRGQMRLCHDARQANVAYLSQCAVIAQEDVLGLQIAVNHLRRRVQYHCRVTVWSLETQTCLLAEL